jgi:hypothetical protein
MSRPEFCAHCKRSGGSFWRATYLGAPDGGVPVHVKCAGDFFRAIDAQPFLGRPEAEWDDV